MYLGASLARLCPSGSLRRRSDWAPVLSMAHSHLNCDNPSVVNRNLSYKRTLSRYKLLQQSQQSLLIPSVRSIKYASRLVDSSPIQLQPFLKLSRLDKPIGSWLLFWPCGWATCLATQVEENNLRRYFNWKYRSLQNLIYPLKISCKIIKTMGASYITISMTQHLITM